MASDWRQQTGVELPSRRLPVADVYQGSSGWACRGSGGGEQDAKVARADEVGGVDDAQDTSEGSQDAPKQVIVGLAAEEEQQR